MKPDDLFLGSSRVEYGIYRVKNDRVEKQYRKSGLLHPLVNIELISREHYEMIYRAPLEHEISIKDLIKLLETSAPEDFPDDGMKAGNVIAIHNTKSNLFFYHEYPYGVIEVPDFAKGFIEPKVQYNMMSEEDILLNVYAIARAEFDVLNEYEPDLELRIVDAKLYGSRENGNYRADSDMDVLLEYEGNMKESALFNAINEAGYSMAGMKLDINPIRKEESGTIEEFLKRNKETLESEGRIRAVLHNETQRRKGKRKYLVC